MSKNNFKDPRTGQEFYIYQYSSVHKDDGTVIYKDRWGKEIVNPETRTVLKPIEKEFTGIPLIAGKFNPKTPEGQNNIKKHFGSRANRFDTKGAGKDTKLQKERDFKDQLIERAKDGKL